MGKLRYETETYSRDKGLDMVIYYDGSKRTQYVGFALPGSATSAAVWQIYKLSYDVTSGGVAKRRYAEGTDDFTHIMDNYASLNYTDI